MRPQLAENVFVTLLRQCYASPRCHSSIRSRSLRPILRSQSLHLSRSQHYHHGPHDTAVSQFATIDSEEDTDVLEDRIDYYTGDIPEPEDYAVLGGGITGLATAYYLTLEKPHAKVTLYEASDRLGGWLKSTAVDVGNGSVVFEQGPRTLRPSIPAGLVTMNMIKKLGLQDQLILTDKESVAAQNRFIYYPDHLVKMPGPGQDIYQILWRLMTEPVFKGIMKSLWEHRVPQRPSSLEDESVGSFLERRLGTPQIGDNIVSAVFHGIYAGDIYQLSMKSLIPRMWYLEGAYPSVSQGVAEAFQSRGKGSTMPYPDAILASEMTSLPDHEKLNGIGMTTASVYSFKKGIGALSEALEMALRRNGNVTIKMSDKVKSVEYDGSGDSIKISPASNLAPRFFDHVISTISGRALSFLTPPEAPLPSLQVTHSVTVMVVNLYYENSNITPERGFGYLLPRSIPFEQNPERALGVVFDSDACIGQDSASGTKLTVMLGGHWWDSFDSYPDEEEGAAMAKAVLRRHLKIDEEPIAVRVSLQKECIPQYTVGHEKRMKAAHGELMRGFKGKLSVAGNSYTGVGLNDCVRGARDVVKDITGYQGAGGITGLERFTSEQRWVKVTHFR